MENINTGQTQKARYKAIFSLVIAALMWSTGGVLIKLVNWNPIAISGLRSAIAALVILCVIKKPKISFSFYQIAGAVAYTSTLILFVTANKMTTAANAILLQYTAPIYVAIFSAWFLKEKITLLDWFTIFAVIGGMVLFFMDSVTAGNLTGNILAILSGICFAALAMLMRKQKNESPLESIFIGNIMIALVSIPFMFKTMPDTKSLIGLFILGVFQIGIPYIFYSYAIKNVTALEAVLIPVLEPVLNPVWVFLVVGEIPGVWSVVGGIIVLFFITARCTIVAVRSQKSRQLSRGGEVSC
ncbi:EamA-like transporter family protein [Oxobacter pfennigii]|uniref:EamA-like transporter family protein n=1 Tax=Oxobacter pfennigii TaxID=36849 RepID=A0A0P8W383_9CLOT|nr:DMT family transporter [Oxobacter pfennigii]KPU43046.1 EamA-like transporter family protein [Oxobacter pfennigii]